MGRSEYGFIINSIDELKLIINIIKSHNECENYDLVGETLHVIGFLNYGKRCALLAHNSGGRDATTTWFESYLPITMEWYPPFEKPDDWLESTDYICVMTNINEENKLMEGWIPESVNTFLTSRKF